MPDTIITDNVDTYLKSTLDRNLNKKLGSIELEMTAPGQDGLKEWKQWLPISSKVTDEEIKEFEVSIGYKLPGDYKLFLKHKHFYDLYIAEASFCSHAVNKWQASLTKFMLEEYPKKFLFDKGYLPFANWSDWGCLCFDTNRGFLSENYPVVLWDHEVADWNENFSSNFKTLLKKLDKEHQKMQAGE